METKKGFFSLSLSISLLSMSAVFHSYIELTTAACCRIIIHAAVGLSSEKLETNRPRLKARFSMQALVFVLFFFW